MAGSRKVIDDLLRGREAERVGLMGSPWGDTLAAWIAQGYPTRLTQHEVGDQIWRDDGQRVLAEEAGEHVEPVPPWRHFGYDMVGVGPWFDIQPLRGHSELVTESDEWTIERNGAGAALKYWKHKSGTPEHIDFRMTTRAVWERDYRPHLLELDPQRVRVDELRRNLREADEAGAWTHLGHMFIWELMRQSMGDVTMYESLLLDPAWLHDYFQVYTAFFKTHFQYMFDQVGLPDGIWIYEDLGYKNGLFASPKVLGELVFPYYAELNAFFHDHDLPVVLHTCGSTAAALPMIIEAGFDALNPMERKALDNDPFAFAERYGDRIAFVGGLDARILETNDRELIGREVEAFVEGIKVRGGRLVFATDHSISPRTNYDSYRHALDVYRQHMAY